MSKPEILIFHEYGAPEHFTGLLSLAEQKKVKVSSFEFSFVKLGLKAILRRDLRALRQVFRSFFTLLALPLRPGSLIILGIAPWDWRLLLFLIFAPKHEIVLFTSWPYWQGNWQPKQDISGLNKRMWHWALKNRFHAVASVTVQGSRSLKQITETPVHTVFHAVDTPKAEQAGVRQGLLYVGRLVPEKGVMHAIDIALKTNRKLTIVGDGPLKEKVSEAAAASELIEYLGYVSDAAELSKLFASHEVLLLPSQKTQSWEEVFGLVIVEALRQGCIPLSSDHIGPKDILENVLPELLFTEQDVSRSMAENLGSIIESREQLEPRMLKVARMFEVDAISSRWEFVIKIISKQEDVN